MNLIFFVQFFNEHTVAQHKRYCSNVWTYYIPQGKDPVRSAFVHLQTCRKLSGKLKAFSNKLEAIRDVLFRFTLKMLDLCHGRGQVEAFLARDDDIHGLSVRDESSMPRIYQERQTMTFCKT